VQAPPIPSRFVAAGGQQVGSVWNHGSYVAPDWSADWLHREAFAPLVPSPPIANRRFRDPQSLGDLGNPLARGQRLDQDLSTLGRQTRIFVHGCSLRRCLLVCRNLSFPDWSGGNNLLKPLS
jgi:hypothetical protein